MHYYIPKILRIHLRVFSIIGYCGMSLNNNLKRSAIIERWLALWSFLLLVLFNVMAFTALLKDDEFLFTTDKFGYFNDALKVIFANIAVTVTYLETIFKRSDIKGFWRVYDCLQKMSSNEKNLITWQELRENKIFLGIFYAFVVLETSAVITFFMFQTITRHLILFWGVFTPFMFTVHLRNLQFIFYIELLRLELVKLKQDLGLLVDYTHFATYSCAFRGFEEFLRNKIVEKQKQYEMIYKMFEHFQNGFGFSIIAVLLMIYVRVLVDTYFAYYTFYRELKKIEIILLIPPYLQIPTFLITSKHCMDVTKLITFNLHSIISQYNNQAGVISAQLQNFSLQILHQRICINGIGISRMDGYMLTRAIGSVTTYMIFFIQFMPKFTSVQQDDNKVD